MQTSQIIATVFPHVSLSFLSTTPILLVLLIIFIILYVIVSLVLFYHWSEYGMGSSVILFAKTVFIAVSLILFTVSFIALNYFRS